MTVFRPNDIIQYAYMTNDIEKACLKAFELFRAGPFYIIEHHRPDPCFYRGEPAELDMTYAFGMAGSAQIEFMVQHNDAPSTFRDMYAPGEEGFHHWAVMVKDFEAEKARYEAAGCVATTEFTTTGKVAWMDCRPLLDGMMELYEENPGTRGFFDLLESSAKDWDGKDPVRPAPF